MVVLGHCFGADRHFWNQQLAVLQRYRVLRYDTRGHGDSGTPDGPYTLDDLAADLVALLNALHIDRMHYIGVSMGGMIGQTFALDYPERLRSLGLINTTSEYSKAQRALWKERIEHVLSYGMDDVIEPLMVRWFSDAAARDNAPGYAYMKAVIKRFPARNFALVAEAVRQVDYSARLGEIKVPTLVVASPDDPGISREASEHLRDAIAESVFHWLSPARHLATLEQPAAFNQMLAAFLSEHAVPKLSR